LQLPLEFLPPLIFGDSVPLNVRLVEPNPGGGIDDPWRDVDLDGKTIRVGIGQPGGKPSSGTFTLTYGGNATASLPFNATSAQVATALNALASIISAGGVTVSGAVGGYRIAFVTSGARTAITADTDALYPASQFVAIVAQEGDGSTEEVVLGTLKTQPAAYAELTEIPSPPSIDISMIQESVVSDGTFTLTYKSETTGPIDLLASNTEIAAAINELATITTDGGVTVTSQGVDYAEGLPQYRMIFISFVDAFTLTDSDFSLDDSGILPDVRSEATRSTVGSKPRIKLYIAPGYRTGIQRITLAGVATGGLYRLGYDGASTDSISYFATTSDVQSALSPIVPNGCTVSQTRAGQLDVSFGITKLAVPLLEVLDEDLTAPSWRTGDLSLNTTGIIELLAGKSSASAQFEIEIYDEATADSWTVYQGACTLKEEIIPSSPASQTGGPVYLTEGSVAAMATPLDVEDDAEKLTLTPSAGQLVRITGEANRIEQFLGGDASEQTSWLVLQNTVDLTVTNYSGSDVTVNGVTCDTDETTNVGWVNPLAVIYSAPDGGTMNSQADDSFDCACASGTNFSTGGTFALPFATKSRSAVTLSIGGA
jgi:hypothetical protein